MIKFVRKRYRMLLVAAACALATIGFVSLLTQVVPIWTFNTFSRKPSVSVPVLEIEGWSTTSGHIYLRQCQGDKLGFFIKHVSSEYLSPILNSRGDWQDIRDRCFAGPPTSGLVYFYDTSLSTLVTTNDDAWTAHISAPTCQCDLGIVYDNLSTIYRKFVDRRPRVYFTNVELTLAAKYVVNMKRSENQKLVAIVSAIGPPDDTPTFFEGYPTKFHGACYLEFVSTDTGVRHGAAIAIPLTADKSHILICWSPDSRYVLCFNDRLTAAVVIPVPALNGE